MNEEEGEDDPQQSLSSAIRSIEEATVSMSEYLKTLNRNETEATIVRGSISLCESMLRLLKKCEQHNQRDRKEH